ncbi:hypothetical protein B0I35DRAFT_485054 [Stachybotrys elegans]|uniref:Uncharacterized protein n=1 Tax=Stachybotrys elegans TaxID=80388 RepID=A0A8K0WKN0_9HYPO|nr:hypothetical protein B0I35DRAFT_485054 [Stachybotrys elegans]
MGYYDSIRNPESFKKAAVAEHMENFRDMFQLGRCPTAVSEWGRRQLFASRAICTVPKQQLSLLKHYLPNDPNVHPCIEHLISGYGADFNLEMSEPEIVRRCQPDSLAYVWTALIKLLRAASNVLSVAPERPQRIRSRPAEYDEFVSSENMQIGSSSPQRPDSAQASISSLGFVQGLSAPLLEDATVRLASCFTRCVLNYGQPLNKSSPFIQYRDERQTYSYDTPTHTLVRATDDGGLQLFDGEDMKQVAMVEGKRNFKVTINGEPVVSDEVLAQLVGEALAIRRHEMTQNISEEDIVTIFAVTHHFKFFHFKIDEGFIDKYEYLSMEDAETFMMVDSTSWFDINVPEHRKQIVSHIMGLMAWADNKQSPVDLDMDI